ncbi:hypothetical protein [Pedobacter sp. R-06]|uniref:hypothetical protein n=1 Tax=Pedobacter sp. R-06 TaxID=3404051 RepID=UPI003CE984D3
MSKLTDKTEYGALFQIAQALHFFENLSDMSVSAGDAVRIRHAENIIKDVITQNGYEFVHSNDREIYLTKDRP